METKDFKISIEKAVKKHQLGMIDDIKVPTSFPTIGSDGLFCVSTSEGRFTFKFIEDKRKLQERVEYHQLLAPILPIPELIVTEENYILFHYIDGETLLDKVLQNKIDAWQYYNEAFYFLRSLWDMEMEEKIVHFKKRASLEIQKAKKPLFEFCGKDALGLEIVVNGEGLNFSIEQIFDQTLDVMLAKDKDNGNLFPRITHGDARLENVLVHPIKGVFFIDLRPGFIDWIDDLVLFGWQRGFRVADFINSPKVNKNRYLEIEFDLKPLLFVDAGDQLAHNVAEKFAGYIGALIGMLVCITQLLRLPYVKHILWTFVAKLMRLVVFYQKMLNIFGLQKQ